MLSITIYSNDEETTIQNHGECQKLVKPLNEWTPYNYKTTPLLHEKCLMRLSSKPLIH